MIHQKAFNGFSSAPKKNAVDARSASAGWSSSRQAAARIPSISCAATREGSWLQAGAAVAASMLMMASPALADLNKYEAEAGGEFGVGSAQQWGEADITGKDFSNQVESEVHRLLCVGPGDHMTGREQVCNNFQSHSV